MSEKDNNPAKQDSSDLSGEREAPAPKKKRRTHLGQWPKGVSGNPSGRPKGAVSLTRILREALKEPSAKRPGLTRAHDLVLTLIDKADEGNSALLQQILDRIDGKVVERVIQDTIEGWTAAVDVSPLADGPEEELA